MRREGLLVRARRGWWFEEVLGEEWSGEFVEGEGVGDGELADSGAAERGEVAAGVEGAAEVAGEGADVDAFAGVDVEGEEGEGVVEDGDGVDDDWARGERGCGALACESVGALALDVDGAEGGWRLEDVAGERVAGGADLV